MSAAPGGDARALPVDTLRSQLLAWYAAHRRDLPWRRTRDPYRIWLSEAMLQQTRVDTVIPYYERFLARFPDLPALAAADEQDVLAEWAGLGYYARARNLHRAARQVVREHGGALPRGDAELAALPGVGRYTRGALRSIAFGERAAVVDGNVRRVLARLWADPDPGEAALWARAEALVPERDAGAFNQALMELGATLCTPRAPECGRCPLSGSCRADAAGAPESYPRTRRRPAPRAVRAAAGVVRRGRDGAVLLVRRPSRGLLGGLWELPSVELAADEGAAPALESGVAARTGLATRTGRALGSVQHAFTHRRLTLELYELERCGGRLRREPDALRWCAPDARDAPPLSALMKRALRRVEQAARS